MERSIYYIAQSCPGICLEGPMQLLKRRRHPVCCVMSMCAYCSNFNLITAVSYKPVLRDHACLLW
jgi:hypothetical protein